MKTLCLIVTFLFFISISVFAQLDSNRIFEKSKGTWQYPLRSGMLLGPSTQGYMGKKAIFITGKSDSVFAVFSGYAVSIKEVDSAYLIITKFKDYYITYYGLTQPLINIGDFVSAGQQIGNLAKDLDGAFSLDIYLNKKSDDLDTHLWFK